MRSAFAAASLLILFSIPVAGQEMDAASRQRMLDVARAERIAFRMAYEQHGRYLIPQLGKTRTSMADALRMPAEELVDPWGRPSASGDSSPPSCTESRSRFTTTSPSPPARSDSLRHRHESPLRKRAQSGDLFTPCDA